MTKFSCLAVQDSKLLAYFTFNPAPRTIKFDELESVNVSEEYVVRNRSYAYWCHVALRLKSGEMLESAWNITAPHEQNHAGADYFQLESLLAAMKEKQLPVNLTFTDSHGNVHTTDSLQERPED